jgi:hypothetical protein
MFRNEPRDRLAIRLKKTSDIAPEPTKYSPSFEAIEKAVKHVDFGYRGALERQKELKDRLKRIKPDLLCSKGVDTCFNSVKRVKKLTNKYCEDTFNPSRFQ